MNRSIRGLPIFTSDAECGRFLELVATVPADHGCTVHGFCIMGNHFHLLLHCPQGGVSKVIGRLAGTYARWYNRRHDHDGPLFRSRFRSVVVESDTQFLAASRYIDRNPLELGYALEGYPWSSYDDHRGVRRHAWLTTDLVSDLAGGPVAYQRLVEAPIDSDAFSISDGYRTWAPGEPTGDVIDATITAVGKVGRAHSAANRRNAVILLLVEDGTVTAADVARRLGLASGGVVRTLAARARVRIVDDVEFARLLAEARGLLRSRAA